MAAHASILAGECQSPRNLAGYSPRGRHRAGEDGETTRQQRRKGQRRREGRGAENWVEQDFFLQAEGGGGDRKVSQLSLDSVALEQFAGSGTQPSLTPADAQQVFPTLGVGAGVGCVCIEL